MEKSNYSVHMNDEGKLMFAINTGEEEVDGPLLIYDDKMAILVRTWYSVRGVAMRELTQEVIEALDKNEEVTIAEFDENADIERVYQARANKVKDVSFMYG